MKLDYRINLPPQDYLQDVDNLKLLEMRVAQNYEVYPVDGWKAYETLVDDGGLAYPIHFRSFVLYTKGKATRENTQKMCAKLWEMISEAFPKDCTVMWRVRPQLKEQEIVDNCEHCGATKEISYTTFIRLRLGCVGDELNKTWSPEGMTATECI